MEQAPSAFWSIPPTEILHRLESGPEGLTTSEARRRLGLYGSNLLTPRKRSDTITLLLSQFKSPIILILLFATGLSFFLHDNVNALIILVIVFGSGLLGFWQEREAANAVEKLLAIVQIKATVLRDGIANKIPVEEIVPGDVIVVSAGDVISRDSLVLESKALYVDEATLTGETYPVRKLAGVTNSEAALSERKGALRNVLEVCSSAETSNGQIVDIVTVREQIEKHFEEFSKKGFRTLGIAYRDLGSESVITADHETNMTFLGFLVLFDPPKSDIVETIGLLKRLGVSLKIITGDNRLVAANLGL